MNITKINVTIVMGITNDVENREYLIDTENIPDAVKYVCGKIEDGGYTLVDIVANKCRVYSLL